MCAVYCAKELGAYLRIFFQVDPVLKMLAVRVGIRRLSTTRLQHIHWREDHLIRSTPRLHPMSDRSPDFELGLDR